MKKIIFFIAALVLLISSSSALAEDWTIVSNWMDLFYENGKDPWLLSKSELSFLNTKLPGFTCQNVLTNENDHQLRCKSRNKYYQGNYQIIFSFGSDNNLVLDAVEIIIQHPYLQNEWNRYNDINRELNQLSDAIKAKDYIADNFQTPVLIPPKEIIHTIMTKDVEYKHIIHFNGSSVSIGQSNGTIILNFCSEIYYVYNIYTESVDPVTGEITYNSVVFK